MQLKLISTQQNADELEQQLQSEQQSSQQKLQQLQAELAAVEQELEPLQAKAGVAEQLEKQLKALQDAENNAKAELDKLRQESKKALTDLQNRDHDVTELKAMLEEFENKLHQATKTETQAVALNKRLQAQLEQLQNSVNGQSNAAMASNNTVDNSAELTQLLAERDDAQQQLTRAQQLTERLTAERDEALAALKAAQQNQAQASEAATPAAVPDVDAALLEEQQAQAKVAADTINKLEKELETLSKQLSEVSKELDHAKHEAEEQRDNALKAQEQLDAMQKAQAADIDDSQDVQATLEQLRANNAMLKEQSAITANHQAEQREVIRQLREELQQQRDLVADMQLEKDKFQKQKAQLEQQVSFVKDNAAATIERLTRYREQAQEKIEKLEKKLGGRPSDQL